MKLLRSIDSVVDAALRGLRRVVLVFPFALSVALPVHAAVVTTPHVEAELVAAKTGLVPGEALTVALRLKMKPGWHTYWRNPGDSGLPTSLAWALPAGVTAGPIEWPTPKALPAGPLMNYGYEGEVLLLTELHVAAGTAATPAPLKAHADWLVCQDVCIPESADLTLPLRVDAQAGADPQWAQRLAAARAALPQPLRDWTATAKAEGQSVELKLSPVATTSGAAAPADLSGLQFFPYTEAQIEPSAPQTLRHDGKDYVLKLEVANDLSAPFTRLVGLLSAPAGLGGTAQAATFDIPLSGAVTTGQKSALGADSAPANSTAANSGPHLEALPVAGLNAAAATGGLTLAAAIGFAFMGGMILNLMPCVFPILSIKLLGLAKQGLSARTLRREAVAFAGGVLLTFVALGLALLLLRAAGEELGWGFQLQSPAVVTALAILFFVLALNLSGVFEFGQLVPAGLANWSAKNRIVDAFGSGVLAVIVASPCTAPFMGAALGYALGATAGITVLVFVALGLGMALPYVLLTWFPSWRKRLPRSGPWLQRFKELLAFPLYATVIWLAWVLGLQRDNDAVLRLLAVLLGVGFALWAWRALRGGGARWWAMVSAAALVATVVAVWPLLATDADATQAGSAANATNAASPHGAAESGWGSFEPTTVAELTSSGRSVFVDFTAAWCVTCQVNKRLVLNTGDVRAAFAAKNVALLRADWTRRDPAITEALARLGRNGVPVYVLYRPGKTPLLLPEVLQKQNVLDALAML